MLGLSVASSSAAGDCQDHKSGFGRFAGRWVGVDVTVSSDAKTLTAVWMGDLPLSSAVKSHAIELDGRRALTRSFAGWFGLHPLFSTVDHPSTRPRVSV